MAKLIVSHPKRFARLEDNPTLDEPALLTLHIAGKDSDYWLYLQPSNFGEAYRLQKIEPTEDAPAELGEAYTVTFQDEFNQTCECRGFVHRGNCKHIDSIKALRDAGRL